MPIYEFQCTSCNQNYDTLTKYDESGMYRDIECPHCGSKEKEKLVSTCKHTFTNPEGTGKWDNSSTGHDYRFKHNLPKVLAEREAAERAQLSGGKNPYRDFDDANKFGEGVHDPTTRGGLA